MNGLSRAKTQRAQRTALLGLLLFSSVVVAEDLSSQVKQARERGIAVLLKKQAADGGWHSETYALLKPGVALTALALDTLSRLPQAEREKLKPQLDNALAFLRKNQNEAGALGATAEWVEYPVYATALAVTAVARLKPEGWAEIVAPWVKWLKSQQYAIANGCQESDAGYGGWSPVGIAPAGLDRRADISVTRHVLQALRAADVPDTELVWPRALKFVLSCQDLRVEPVSEGSGGFCYAPGNDTLNKSGVDDKSTTGFHSYDTATADGYGCLELLKRGPSTNLRVARLWLQFRFVGDVLPECDHAGLRFYQRAAWAWLPELSVDKTKPTRPEMRAKIATATLKEQGTDGLWRNDVDTMKENDPLLATLYALQALIAYTEDAP